MLARILGFVVYFILCVPLVVMASLIGFSPSFTNDLSPLTVTNCNAACTSPGTVTFDLILVRSNGVTTTDTVLVTTRPTSDPTAYSATAGVDYTPLVNVPVVFQPGDEIKTVTVTIISDGVYKDDAYFEAIVTSSPNAGVSIDPNAQIAYLKLVDGGHAGIFSFSASTYSFVENAGLVQVRVVRSGGASGNVTVTYRLANPGQPTAINMKNFQLMDTIYQLIFQENQREAFIPIQLINDDVYEAQEYFYLELAALAPMKASDPTTSVAKFGTQRSTVVFITDDGDAGQFDFAAPFLFCREDNGSAVVSIVRSLGSSSGYTPVTLAVTTVGTSGGNNATEGGSLAYDYQAASNKLMWADGVKRQTFAVKIFNNNKYQPATRAFKIRMTAVEGGASIGPQNEIWVYIVDDRDAGTLAFKQGQYEVLENAGSVTVEIVRTGLTDTSGINTYTSGTVSVDVATFAGTILPGKQKYDDDYDNGVVQTRKCTHVSPCTATAGVAYTPLASTTITFADGENTKTMTIPIIDDTLYEAPDQVFKVALHNVVGGAHIGIDYEHPSEWYGYGTAFLELDKRRNELLDFVGTIVSIKDDGDPAVLVSKASLSVSEIGQTDTFDVWLNSAPQGDVTIAFQTAPTALKLSMTTLKFTTATFATRQTVIVTAVDNKRTQTLPKSIITLSVTSPDPHYNAPLRTSLTPTSGFVVGAKIYTQLSGVYDTGNPEHAFPWTESFGVMASPQALARIVTFTLDNDPAGIVLHPETIRHGSASTISPDNCVAVRVNGHKAVVNVTLASEPAGDVIVLLVVAVDEGINVTPASLTFTATNWNQAQSIEIAAVASAKSGINDGVYFTNVEVVSTSTVDLFYNQPNTAMTTLFVARYPAAMVLLDASVLTIRENDVSGPGFGSYQVGLGSEPMHWEPDGSHTYKPFELTLTATADTTLTLSADAAVAAVPAGGSTTFTAAANATTSSSTTRLVRLGVVRFSVNPSIALATGSHQVGGAKLRLYRVAGGENGGLGGIQVGVSIANGAMAETWDENWLRGDCASDGHANIACSLRNTASDPALPLSSLLPAPTNFLNLRQATAGEALIQPTGSFDTIANTYTPAPGWVEFDVTVTLNAFLATQHQLQQDQQSFATDVTFLVYTTAPSFFVYDGATEVTFASKDNTDVSLHPQLQVLGSGRVNLAPLGSASQSQSGNAQAAIDGQMTSNLGVASTFAMGSTPYKYPWWQADLGSLRLIDEILVTIKKKASAASLTTAQLPVSIWLLLSETSLSAGNNGISGFTTAKTNARFAKQFNISERSFTSPESDTILLRWRVFGAQGHAAFGDDHFVTDYTTTIEARYLLVQVEGENNVVLNEVHVFQPALASAKVALGGYMPSPSVVNNGKNQIGFTLNQPGERLDEECDPTTAVCRHELSFTSGDWWTPQFVHVSVMDDAVATGDRDILLTHTVRSTDASFHGTSVCGSGATDPCMPALFNDSGVKILRVLDDDENVVLFSSSAFEVQEGSGVYLNAPKMRRMRQIFPASVRCSTNASQVLGLSSSTTCTNVFTGSATWATCIATPSAATLASGSAWVMAGFAESDINLTVIVMTIPPMRDAKYIRRMSLWWSDSLDINASSTIPLLDNTHGWTPIRSIDVQMVSRGSQTITITDLALLSIKILLVAFEKSYDDVANCFEAPLITVRGHVAVPFPLAVRGDLTNIDSVPPVESGRSRMHAVGTTATLQVRLASEPIQDITITVVPDPDNAPLSVFDALKQSSTPGTLQGGNYESGEQITFTAPTSLIFTSTNWNQSQALTILAVDDNTYNANRSFSVSHVVTSTEATALVIPHQSFTSNVITRDFTLLSSDYMYTQAPYIVATDRQPTWPRNWSPTWISGRGTIDVAHVDDDLPGVTLSTSVVIMSESASTPSNYSISLDSAPASSVVVTISYEVDDSLLTVSPLRLTFSPTNWKTPQWVYLTPVSNDIYDAGSPLTINYDRLIPKKVQPFLKHKVTSATDAMYNGLRVGGNEPDHTTLYVKNQGVVAIVQDDDTGCPKEYTCLNGGTCVNMTYGGSSGNSSANVCQCPATFGMRNCAADCPNERSCAFRRVAFVLQCRPGDPLAICGTVFSPSRLVTTIYRMLTANELMTSSGKTFPALSLGPMAETMYIVNATTTRCVASQSMCIAVTMDFTTTTPMVEKLYGYFESGSLQTQPLFAEVLTTTPQYPSSFGTTIAVWIFVSFCVGCVAMVLVLMSIRYVKVKRFHVQPDLPEDEANEPLTSPRHVHAG